MDLTYKLVDATTVTDACRMEISDYVEKYTIPIYLCNKEHKPKLTANLQNGSGVLVSINGNPFILTAGHCVNQWLNMRLDHIVVAIEPFVINLKVVKWNHRYCHSQEDYGFFSVEPDDMEQLELLSKELLAEDRIFACNQPRGSQAVISGFPKPFQEKPHRSHTIIIGKVSNSQDYRKQELFKVAISDEELEEAVGTPSNYESPASGGMSGGGCWLTGNITSEDWTTNQMLLIGTHFLADKRPSSGQLNFEMSVSKHLELIANTR